MMCSLTNKELYDEEIINYLRINNFFELLVNDYKSSVIGIMYENGKYIVYENNERGVPFSNIEFYSFEEALEEARGYYDAFCKYNESIRNKFSL